MKKELFEKYSQSQNQNNTQKKFYNLGKHLVIEYTIKENSWVARLAAFKLHAAQMAIVIGSTIHLYKVNRNNFIADACWLRHEQCHLKQFKEHGFWGFIFKYTWESIRKGYFNNKFEVEARAAEKEPM